jgi:ABC-type transport system substrate-binding protein
VLESYLDFYDGPPPVDRLVFRFIQDTQQAIEQYRRGEISIMSVSGEMAGEIPSDEIIVGPSFSTQFINFNLELDTPFKNKKVRQAVNHIIDCGEYTQDVLKGQALASHGIFPPGMDVYDKDMSGYSFDIAEARALMERAGYPHGLDRSYTLDMMEGGNITEAGEYFKKCFAEIGITVEPNPMPFKDMLDKICRHESILAMTSWVGGNGDPDQFVYPLFHSRSTPRTGNASFFRNEDIDRLIEQARAERNAKRRCEMYRLIESRIIDEAPWVFLSHQTSRYAVSNQIGGFQVDPGCIVRFRYLWCR